MNTKSSILCLLAAILCICGLTLTSCSDIDDNNASRSDTFGSVNIVADLVVYGSIYTSEDDATAEAFAVKDGEYIAVGNKADIERYVSKGKQV